MINALQAESDINDDPYFMVFFNVWRRLPGEGQWCQSTCSRISIPLHHAYASDYTYFNSIHDLQAWMPGLTGLLLTGEPTTSTWMVYSLSRLQVAVDRRQGLQASSSSMQVGRGLT